MNMAPRWAPRIFQTLLLAALYYAGGSLGLALHSSNVNITAIWPPTGIAVAALLLRGRWLWPGVAIGAFVTNVQHAGPTGALLISVGNTLAPYVAALVLEKIFDFHPNLDRPQDVVALVVVGGIAAMLISSTLGTTALAVTNNLGSTSFTNAWMTWWIGDAMGVVMVAPPIVTLASTRWADSIVHERFGEAVASVLLFAFGFFLFTRTSLPVQFLAFVVIAFVAWASLRFRQQGAALAMFIVAGATTWAAYSNHTAQANIDLTTRLMGLDLFNASLSLAALILGSLEAEREEGRLALELATSQLEDAVRRRTRQLEEAMAATEAASTAKTEYLSRMSHELRTPLTAIIGFAELMAMDEALESGADRIQLIIKAADHLEALVDDALDIARIEEGRLRLSLEPTDLVALCDEVLDLLSTTAREKAVRLNRDYENRSHCYVLADGHRLLQVIMNLVSNAIKYGGDQVDVTIREAPGGRFRLAVKDHGHGLSKESIASLFQPFERLGAERTSIQGTGLGLALSKRLVEAMNAGIGVDSVVSKGSTFWIDIAGAQAPHPSVFETMGGSDAAEPNVEKKVLHIEDNPDVVDLLQRAILLRPRIHLVSATTGEEGIAIAKGERPDLILLDVHLPDLDGSEVLTQLKGDEATAAIPVIVLSADATPPQIEALIALGARAYVTKPIRVTHFLETIDQTLAAQDVLQPAKP